MSTQYPENVRTFIHEMAEYISQPQEIDGSLILPIRKEMIADPNVFHSFCHVTALPLAEHLKLKDYFKLSFEPPIGFRINLKIMLLVNASEENEEPTSNFDDPIQIHIDRLKTAFQRVSPEEIAESVKVLAENGWDDTRFAEDFNMSPASIWRYRNGKSQRKKQNKASSEASVSFPQEKTVPN